MTSGRRRAGPSGRGSGSGLLGSGLLLAAATTVANLCGYGFTLVVSRSLGPADFGAVGALLNLTLIATVPLLALQLVAARSLAGAVRDRGPGSRPAASGLARVALVSGAGLGLVMACAAGPLESFLHLEGRAPVVLAAGVVTAGAGSFLAQGLLQGRERFAALSLVYALAGVTRFAAGASAAALGYGQTGVMALTCLAAVLTTVVAAGVTLRSVPELRRPRARAPGGPAAPSVTGQPGREVLRSTVSTAGLFLLLNIDVLLARHYLPRDASGLYAVGSMFAKAAFWAPQFLATLLYPGMAVPQRRRAAVIRGLALTTAAGAAAVAACALAGRPALRLLFGATYLPLAPHLWVFGALGASLAVVQLIVYAHLAAGNARWGATTSLVALAVWALVAWRWHGTVVEVAGTASAGAMLLAVAGTVRALLTGPAAELSGPASGAAGTRRWSR